MDVLLLVLAVAVAGVLIWLRWLPKVVVVLAFTVGAGIDGRLERWITAALRWLSGKVGWLFHWAIDVDAKAVAAAVPAAVGLVLAVIVVKHMWPNKGKASTGTAAAALFLPLLWGAMMAALEQVSPGITGGA